MQSVRRIGISAGRSKPDKFAGSRSLSTSVPRQDYASTLPNLAIGKHTRVIFQGFTGRQATANAQESLAWGTNIVGGVTPGREGYHLGLPVLPTVRRAMDELRPDATGIYVAAHQAPAAIEEAIEAEVPLIVAVAEHIPLHDVARIHQMLKTQSRSRLVGPNSPGVISAAGRCRIGFQPLPCFSPGRVGIVAKSGTLSYEAVASTTRAGLGQSLCVGVGGDVLPGTDLREALSVLEDDEHTEAIALVGEIGGDGEVRAARWIEEHRARSPSPKPIVALVAGVNAVPGRVMGHAGAFAIQGEPSARQKIAALERAGVTMVNHPSKFGEAIKKRLEASRAWRAQPVAQQQRHGMHTLSRKRLRRCQTHDVSTPCHQTRRSLHLQGNDCKRFLDREGRGCSLSFEDFPYCFLAVRWDRASRSPCLVAALLEDAEMAEDPDAYLSIPYEDPSEISLDIILRCLGLSKDWAETLQATIDDLTTLFTFKEAYNLQLAFRAVHRTTSHNHHHHQQQQEGRTFQVIASSFGLDDAAFRSANRQADVHRTLRRIEDQDSAEVEAAKHGIVYVKLPGRDGHIGTLVNGAGLAMNTVDALADAGGQAANFLDTGGKATSETVRKSFEIVLRDPRVRVILVNIFGGLTLGDMIARGVVLAFREVKVDVPVVVRIRGTNEAEGQKIIEESGLPLYAFGDFDEAAAKAMELAKRDP